MRTRVHIISHSHWDREWYMAFEKHRMKLVELIDETMKLFAEDASFRSFHLDGQTIVLDDYLEIKPENRGKLEKYVREGRFQAGPWYILQDEFLTSGEANVRNLLTGMREAEKFGKVCRIGYFPDAFGNAGQMPQLLKQAGMKAVVFGRGVKPVGFDNKLVEGGEYESAYSEMNWESPDGSSLLGILFANWYNNGAEIPTDPEKAKAFWDERLTKARAFAGTRQLLFMNGCDHQPVQRDLSEAIKVAESLYPDIEFVHSDFESYVEAVASELEDKITTVQGELTSQETDGLWTLVNTASSRVDLKQRNRACETALELEAEPLSVMAYLCGRAYPKELLCYGWKKLLQNHPHDSICCCSVDEVHAEMKTRFDKSLQVAESISGESLQAVAGQIDTSCFGQDAGQSVFAVFNSTAFERTGMVSAQLNYIRSDKRILTEGYEEVDQIAIPALALFDAEGNPVAARIEDMGSWFGYDLPDDRFRQPYMARKLKVTFEAKQVPAFGYRAYVLREKEEEAEQFPREKHSMAYGFDKADVGCPVLENDYLRVEINEDGSYTLTEKSHGRRYSNMGYYEDTGDIGNEYVYVQDGRKETVVTKGGKAEVVLEEDSPFRAVCRIEHCMEVPKGAEGLLCEEQIRCVEVYQRKAGRSQSKTALHITTRLILEKSAKGLKVETAITNTAKNHRVRVILPTGLAAESHYADTLFDVVKRPNRRPKTWKNPSGCDRQHNFAAISDGEDGILAANIGLYEYEILPGQDNAIALTLLRAVGEMGDWGYFPTPDAQMQGSHTLSYCIIPFRGQEWTKAFQAARQFQTELKSCQIQPGAAGKLPPVHSFFSWKGEGLNLTGMKQKEDSEDIIVRYVNSTEEPVVLYVEHRDWMKTAYRSNVVEENLGALTEGEDGSYQVTVRPHEILSVGFEVR